MTTQPTPHESVMLEKVRRWREEAFEAARSRTPEQREHDRAQLLKRFGLAGGGKKERRRPDVEDDSGRAA